jgi:hypothetical protein
VNVGKSLYTKAFFDVKADMPFSYLPWALEPLLTENVVKIKFWDLANSSLILEKMLNSRAEITQQPQTTNSAIFSIDRTLPIIGLKRAKSQQYLHSKNKKLYFI